MRRFQRNDNGVIRFWNISCEGTQLTVRYGFEGKAGRTQVSDYPSYALAYQEMERRVALRRQEGYTEIIGISPMQQSLEDALQRDPEDRAAHMAYADWLFEQPDEESRARGEYIQIQLALEDPALTASARQELMKRELQLFEQHRKHWLGELAEIFSPNKEPVNRITFRRGWVDKVHLTRVNAATMCQLIHAPQLALMRELAIADGEDEIIVEGRMRPEDRKLLHPYSGYHALALLRGAKWLSRLEVLSLGDVEGTNGFSTYRDGDHLPDVLERAPRLRELNLNVRNADVTRFATSKALESLHTLRLERMRLYDDGIRLLAQSNHLKNLRVLQIWNARITDEGLRVIRRSKWIKQLELLDISFNWVTTAGIEMLKKTGIPIIAEYPLPPAEDDDDEWDDVHDEDGEFSDDDFDADWE